jgi:hypothetical protein
MLKFTILVATLMLTSTLVYAQAIGPADWKDARPSSSITVSPGGEPGVYVVRAKVTDLKTSKILATPELKTVAGTPATFELGIKDKVIIKFVVTINETGQEASYISEVRRNGELESSQEASLSLAKRG